MKHDHFWEVSAVDWGISFLLLLVFMMALATLLGGLDAEDRLDTLELALTPVAEEKR